ncbi:MAG: SDR family oxidoreductase [Kiritimatiellae bacterium]|nr:SDR family oxidoreductase [Kiritimatiellia bacterium]
MRILVTGSNRGLGLEFVRQYLGRGERVVACCRAPDRAAELKTLQKQFADRLTVLRLEVTDAKSRAAAHRRVKRLFGALDLLVNNAGIRSGARYDSPDFGELCREDILRVFEVNAVAPLLMAERFFDLLRKGTRPRVVNITSMLGSITEKDWVFRYSYCASKAALNMFSKMLALDLRDKRVAVLALHPGHVQTDLGGSDAPLVPEQSIRGMIKVIDGLRLRDSGKFLDWRGRQIAW